MALSDRRYDGTQKDPWTLPPGDPSDTLTDSVMSRWLMANEGKHVVLFIMTPMRYDT